MDIDSYYAAELDEHLETYRATRDALREPFARLVAACAEAVRQGGKIVFFGNGGSAADAQHLATELTVRFVDDRAPIPGLALTTDTSTLTASGNDMGFKSVFARQVEALCGPTDVIVGISTSGRSDNVNLALEAARRIGAVTVGLGGRDGGPMKDLVDIAVIVPSNVTARIQEMHITIGHMLCGALEKELGLV